MSATHGPESDDQSKESLSRIIESLRCENMVIKNALSEEVSKRKVLFNQVQETKGNIRVIARVRPMTEYETKAGETTRVSVDERASTVQAQKSTFAFDRVFGQASLQESVYEEVKSLVDSALDGYNVCLFAYGQTGSGKTFTMEGTPAARGINYRFIRDLFSHADLRSTSSFAFTASVFEIYNENIKDLQDSQSISKDLKLDEFGMKQVGGAVKTQISSFEDAWKVIEQCQKLRSVTQTQMNDRSSRSHLIVSVDIVGRHLDDTITRSRIYLIDLAGCERVDQTGASGKALDEAKSINKSLSVLSRVISSLSEKSSISPPYRESKLTHLLQDALSGQSKTVVLVQLSPVEGSLSQSLNTLSFASRVKTIQLAPPKKNVDHNAITAELKRKMIAEIADLKAQNEKLADLNTAIQEDLNKALEAEGQARTEADSLREQVQILRVELSQMKELREMERVQARMAAFALASPIVQQKPVRPMEPITPTHGQHISFTSVADGPLLNPTDTTAQAGMATYKRTPVPKKRNSRSPSQLVPYTATTMGDQRYSTSTALSTLSEDTAASLSSSESGPIEIANDSSSSQQSDDITVVSVTFEVKQTVKSCLKDRAIERPKKRVRFNDPLIEDSPDTKKSKANSSSAQPSQTFNFARPAITRPSGQVPMSPFAKQLTRPKPFSASGSSNYMAPTASSSNGLGMGARRVLNKTPVGKKTPVSRVPLARRPTPASTLSSQSSL